jgi:hypothetical protein
VIPVESNTVRVRYPGRVLRYIVVQGAAELSTVKQLGEAGLNTLGLDDGSVFARTIPSAVAARAGSPRS